MAVRQLSAPRDGFCRVEAMLEGILISLRGSPATVRRAIRHRPFGIGGARHELPLHVRAPQRGVRCMSNLVMRHVLSRVGCPTAVGQWDSRYLPGRVLCARESLQLHVSFRSSQIDFRDGSCELSDFKRLVCECI